jgi:hypothetical protein
MFSVPPLQKMCFFEEVDYDGELVLDWAVLQGGLRDIRVEVLQGKGLFAN